MAKDQPYQEVAQMADETEFVTINGLSKALGLSYKSAKKHVDSGLWKPVTHGQHQGKFNLAKCRELYAMAVDPINREKGELGAAAATGSPPPSSSSNNPMLTARLHSQVFEAKARQLKFDKASGKLIDREEARRACLAVISVVNERVEGAASQIAVRVAGNASVPECERICKDVLRQVRVEIAGLGAALDGVGVDA